MSLTDEQIDLLGWICDDSGFIADTISLISSFEGMGKKPFIPRREEVENVIEFLSGMSEELQIDIKLSHAVRMHQKKIENDLFIPRKYSQIPFKITAEDNLVHQMQLAIEKLLEPHPLDGPNTRNLIGLRAFEILNRYNVHAGTSNTGAFTKYLTIVRDASGVNFSPHNLARDVIKASL